MAETSVQTKNQPHATGWPHAVIEFTERVHGYMDSANSLGENANKAVKLYRGMEAFRRYNWIANAPSYNSTGENFRGMVISKSARSAFDITVENGEKFEQLGRALFLAGVAIEIANNSKNLTLRPKSTEDVQRLLLVPSMAILKVFGSPIPMAAHILARSIAVTCGLGGWKCEALPQITSIDYTISQSYNTMMDPENVLKFINTNTIDVVGDRIQHYVKTRVVFSH